MDGAMARQKNIKLNSAIFALLLGCSFTSSVWAFGPDEEATPPPSRFGAPPTQVITGVSPGYAMRAVEDSDSTALDVGGQAKNKGATRGIASAGEAPAPAPVNTSVPSADEINEQMVQRGVQEVSVIASDLGYFPKTVFVSRDVPVRMYVTGSSKNTLCIMMDSFQVRRQVRSQRIEEINFIPGVPGKYRFYCPVNGMEGTLVVKEFSSRQ
jgi:plastocyanin